MTLVNYQWSGRHFCVSFLHPIFCLFVFSFLLSGRQRRVMLSNYAARARVGEPVSPVQWAGSTWGGGKLSCEGVRAPGVGAVNILWEELLGGEYWESCGRRSSNRRELLGGGEFEKGLLQSRCECERCWR